MQTLLSNIKISINDKIFIKDPETSDLGKKIIEQSIILIEEMGFEHFTFKKLGEKIGSNESSIYRYFENKHKLLVYLTSWYWGWIEYKLAFSTNNITNLEEKLKIAIAIVTEKIEDDLSTKHIDESLLHKIMVAEFTKTLLTKEVEEENKEGYFLVFKRVIYRIAEIIEEINPDYTFSKSLASTIVQGALSQFFMSEHLKTITNCNLLISPTHFYINLALRTLKD
jgi:AcrR family transcriptional regulator